MPLPLPGEDHGTLAYGTARPARPARTRRQQPAPLLRCHRQDVRAVALKRAVLRHLGVTLVLPHKHLRRRRAPARARAGVGPTQRAAFASDERRVGRAAAARSQRCPAFITIRPPHTHLLVPARRVHAVAAALAVAREQDARHLLGGLAVHKAVCVQVRRDACGCALPSAWTRRAACPPGAHNIAHDLSNRPTSAAGCRC